MGSSIKNIAILGSTGSIGTQTLDVISQHPDRFHAALITANNNAQMLASQALEFGAEDVVICNEEKYAELCSAVELETKRLKEKGVQVHAPRLHAGMEAVCQLVQEKGIDIVVTAMVGFSGVRSTVAAAKAGKTIALANKETLVAAGSVVTRLVRENGATVVPVDSEHSAIFQCLQGNIGQEISKIHLTASGGPFRLWDKADIAAAKASAALKHPNWNMGAKVTIDSASMMNKGLEVIEAKWLFDVDPDRINVVVHPQSIIHSMVEYEDGAVIAQLGHPDMREPIQYALSYPDRLTLNNRKLDFAALAHLDFYAPDMEKFPCLGIAFDAIRCGGTAPAIMNAANEAAVKAYLQDRIAFYDIADIIRRTMDGMEIASEPVLDEIFAANDRAYDLAQTLINKL